MTKPRPIRRDPIRFPSIANVASELRAINRTLAADSRPALSDDDESGSCDIRLQVYPDGQWAIRVGSSDYDQDHRGFWGCSSLDGKRFDSERTAKDLLEQVKEHASQR